MQRRSERSTLGSEGAASVTRGDSADGRVIVRLPLCQR